MWGSELSLLWESLCNVIILQLWVTHLGEKDLTISQVRPSYLSCCGLFLMSLVVEGLFW